MNQLQKYTWLIDTIRRAGKISHKDLSDRWSRNKDFSDGHELHRATFNRWRDAIFSQSYQLAIALADNYRRGNWKEFCELSKKYDV